ncbi:hypothetical protein M9458_051958, partial [Cirrhinus mrigala]
MRRHLRSLLLLAGTLKTAMAEKLLKKLYFVLVIDCVTSRAVLPVAIDDRGGAVVIATVTALPAATLHLHKLSAGHFQALRNIIVPAAPM